MLHWKNHVQLIDLTPSDNPVLHTFDPKLGSSQSISTRFLSTRQAETDLNQTSQGFSVECHQRKYPTWSHCNRVWLSLSFGSLHFKRLDLLIAFTVPVFEKQAKRKLVRHSKLFFFEVGVYRSLRPKGSKSSRRIILWSSAFCPTAKKKCWSWKGFGCCLRIKFYWI